MRTEYKTVQTAVEYKVDRGKRTVESYASIFGNRDLGRDRVHEGAFRRSLQKRGLNVPLLYQHDHMTPIGRPLVLKEDSRGLYGIDKIVKTRAGDEVLELLAEGVISGFSFGYTIDEGGSEHTSEGRELKSLDIFERSVVTFPMNELAGAISVRKSWMHGGLYLPHCQKCQGCMCEKGAHEDEDEDDKTTPVIEVTSRKGAIPYRSYPTADRSESWDGPAEIAEADTDDLRIMATWVDEEAPDVKSSYKLPHHRASDFRLVWRGVTAAMAALLGARGGVDIPDSDRQGVYEHLARHYRDDFDEEPPEFRSYSDVELKEMFPDLWEDDVTEPDQSSDDRETLDALLSEMRALRLDMMNTLESLRQ